MYEKLGDQFSLRQILIDADKIVVRLAIRLEHTGWSTKKSTFYKIKYEYLYFKAQQKTIPKFFLAIIAIVTQILFQPDFVFFCFIYSLYIIIDNLMVYVSFCILRKSKLFNIKLFISSCVATKIRCFYY